MKKISYNALPLMTRAALDEICRKKRNLTSEIKIYYKIVNEISREAHLDNNRWDPAHIFLNIMRSYEKDYEYELDIKQWIIIMNALGIMRPAIEKEMFSLMFGDEDETII